MRECAKEKARARKKGVYIQAHTLYCLAKMLTFSLHILTQSMQKTAIINVRIN